MNAECPITLAAIVRQVSRARGIPARHIYGRRQDEKISEARHCVYWLSRELHGLPASVIGRLLGDRDHSTILAGHKVMEAARAADPVLAAELASMKASLIGSARAQLTSMLADPDPAAVAQRIASSPDPIREGLRASALEIAAMAVRLTDVEEIAAATFQLLVRSNRARALSGEPLREYTAGTIDLVETIADALGALGYADNPEPETTPQPETLQ
jgi:hypothetical protein